MNIELTQDTLKQYLNYDHETGIFTWNKRLCKDKCGGMIAGTLSKDTGYIRISFSKKLYYAHRLAWLYVYGVWPEKLIDHKDGIRNNNRIENLRCATHSQNRINKDKRSGCSSKFKNVCFDKSKNSWMARIKIEGKDKFLGRFKTQDEAMAVASQWAKDNYGEFYRS